ncbi:MAG: radical SAM protein [Candidatus Aminicenantes bacterium]|nr:radical SAM protein [Candidatus Aminicenantes bacterium]
MFVGNNFDTAIYDVSIPCNYRCIYCRNDWQNPENTAQPPFEKIKPIIDKFYDLGIKKIIFTGGEFFTVSYWQELLAYTKKKGFAVWIVTNAALIEPAYIPFLEKHVEKINVSFHSADKKLYQKIMGVRDKSIFDKVIRNLEKLGESKIRLGIFFSPLRSNFRQFYDTIRFLKESGVDISQVSLNRIIPTQHTLAYFEDEQPLSYFEHKVLIEQLIRINRELHIDAYAEAYPLCFLKTIIADDELLKKINQPCIVGRRAIAVNNNGTLKLCPATAFAISAPISETARPLQTNSTLDDFNEEKWRNNHCISCAYWQDCLGGCHASTGKIYSDDALIIDDEIEFKEDIENTFFDLLVNLYKPFLSTSFKNAHIRYTVLSKYKDSYPIGIIAVKKTRSNANFLEIALVPGLKEKYYSFLILQKLIGNHSIEKYGWTAHKANLPSIKLLEKLDGGFYQDTVKNKKRIEAEGFFRVNGPVPPKMKAALKELIPQAGEKFKLWLREFDERKKEKQALKNYLEGYKP